MLRTSPRGHFFSSLVIAMTLLALAGCRKPSSEQALRDTIAGMQAAVEARDVDALVGPVAEDFIGPDGMDRAGARRMAQLLFLRNGKVGATLGPLDVQLQGQGATVRFTAALTGGSGGLLPSSAQVYEVATGWRMRDGDWTLVSVEWKPRI